MIVVNKLIDLINYIDDLSEPIALVEKGRTIAVLIHPEEYRTLEMLRALISDKEHLKALLNDESDPIEIDFSKLQKMYSCGAK
jgi:PHD/YefM family antitoxin component YafN of YafNO toxin-antitoxin module